MTIKASNTPKSMHGNFRDFWLSSLLLFCACRVGDFINAFIGLWLIPKYVSEQDLGAVLPLSTFASFLALPVYIFAMTFMKEVNTLAERGEYGKMKTLMHGVFIASSIFLGLAIILSRLLLPLFLERLRLVEGSLGLLILASGFLGCAAPIFTNALQALKKFKALSLLQIFGAPFRLLTMLLTMPLRPLSGFFAGQCAPALFSIFGALFSLRRELAAPAERYWTKKVFHSFLLLFLGMAGYQLFAFFPSLIEQSVLRQRLPDIDSAGYYMVSRFSDIANYLGATFLATLFPFTAARAIRGEATRPFVFKASFVLIGFNLLLALFFINFGHSLLKLLPQGEKYCAYAWAIPWLIANNTLISLQTFHTNTEVSAGRFGFLKWWIPFSFSYPILLLLVTGVGYYQAALPPAMINFIAKLNITSLRTMLIWLLCASLVKLGFCLFDLARQGSSTIPNSTQ